MPSGLEVELDGAQRAIAAPEYDLTSTVEDEHLAFDAVVEVRPTVNPAGYESLRVTIDSPEVTEDEIEQQLERLREAYGQLEAVERAAEAGDHVLIDIVGARDGEPLEGLEADGYLYEVGSGAVVPELDEQLTVLDNMILYGRYFDIPRAECRRRAAELMEFVQLSDRAKQRVDPLSGGMKRRITIARALINNPELILLDEPTTGLDPQARHVLWDRLYRLKQRGVTLVLSTHYMDEAEQLCDRLVVMDQGRIVAMGSPLGLIREYSTREVLELRYPAGTNESKAPELDGVGVRQEVLPDRVLIYADDGEDALSEVHRRNVAPESALVRRSSLEDVFLRLTGRSLVD